MPRPLKQLGVGQLEALFARSKTDLNVLEHLAYELQYRQVPRAVALLTEVQAAMPGASLAVATTEPQASASLAPGNSSTVQDDLWERPLATPAISTTTMTTPRPPASAGIISQASAIASPQPRAVPTMTVDDACKVLGVAAGATWESIEQSRRLLVQQSYPERVASMSSIKREQARDGARRVNDAYAVLLRLRTGGNSKLMEV